MTGFLATIDPKWTANDKLTLTCNSNFYPLPFHPSLFTLVFNQIVAAEFGGMRMCKWLLGKNANMHNKDSFGRTAMDFAIHNANAELIQMLAAHM